MGYWLDQERKRSERIARAHRARAMEAEAAACDSSPDDKWHVNASLYHLEASRAVVPDTVFHAEIAADIADCALDKRQRDRRAAELAAVPTPKIPYRDEWRDIPLVEIHCECGTTFLSRQKEALCSCGRLHSAQFSYPKKDAGGSIGAADCVPGALVGGSKWQCTGGDIGSVTINTPALDQHGLPTAVAATT